MHRADGLCYPGSASRLSCRRRQRHGRGSAPQSGEERYRGVTLMFIAMTRFQVLPGEEKAFETVWLSRDTFLVAVPGFVAFPLSRGPEADACGDLRLGKTRGTTEVFGWSGVAEKK